jgi:hypothetical protein
LRDIGFERVVTLILKELLETVDISRGLIFGVKTRMVPKNY